MTESQTKKEGEADRDTYTKIHTEIERQRDHHATRNNSRM